MSREYRMDIIVDKHNEEKYDDIKEAIEEEWVVDDCLLTELEASFSGESSLCGGESEEEFAKRISTAIMKANEGPCKVTVHAAYLEDLPHETYNFDETDYAKLMKEST